VPLASDSVIDYMPLEFTSDEESAVTAHAHEADSSTRQALDSGDADFLRKAVRNHLALVERDEKNPTHFFLSRLAAAIASPRLL